MCLKAHLRESCLMPLEAQQVWEWYSYCNSEKEKKSLTFTYLCLQPWILAKESLPISHPFRLVDYFFLSTYCHRADCGSPSAGSKQTLLAVGVIDLNGFDFFPSGDPGIGSVKIHREREGQRQESWNLFVRLFQLFMENLCTLLSALSKATLLFLLIMQFIIFI